MCVFVLTMVSQGACMDRSEQW